MIVIKIITIFSLLLIVFGTIGNLIAFKLCLSISSTNAATFVFLRFLSLSDAVSLYFWNFAHFYQAYFEKSIYEISPFFCAFPNFCQCVTLQLSAWLLVIISWERLLSVTVKNWSLVYFKGYTPLYTAIVLTLVIVGLNSHIFFTYGFFVDLGNGTKMFTCQNNPNISALYTIPTTWQAVCKLTAFI